ncbi:damage-inducible protein [Phaeovibrio sulfidiphilus]|uniref:Damage-inducible protein n=1 Tax=Phaeovibrio sulfidiphilus TaxID=1220600 RepID=A0A8J6YIX8_9PROT|nr:damage-inducible protein [Phaeovibrio sulfidiphilus]MBE1237131.1 damage-inducible protein [Phaeovibrio sulfidiphilus]
MPTPCPALAALRAGIERIEGRKHLSDTVLPFGLAALDGCLPGGGLALHALHEVAGGEPGPAHAAAATLFAAGIASRLDGPVLWCLGQPDLFPPALARAGLTEERIVYAEAPDNTALLSCFEEGLRHGGPAVVIGEVTALSLTASRRLQLAAEQGKSMGIAIRRPPRSRRSAHPFLQPGAAATRWTVSSRPTEPLGMPGVGRGRWHLELVRCRGGRPGEFEVEECDETGSLGLVSLLGHRGPSTAGTPDGADEHAVVAPYRRRAG